MCTVEGCDTPDFVKGLCKRHYHQMWRHGKIIKTKFEDNKIIVMENHAKIELIRLNGSICGYAIVDLSDLERVSSLKWHMTKSSAKPYAVNCTKNGITLLHRYIMEITDPNIEVDHINSDGLDCRRENMRIVTRQQNCCNVLKRSSTASSLYKGVHFSNDRKKWIAKIACNRKNYHIGVFNSEIVAAIAYNRFAKRLHGEYAKLNRFEL